MKTPDKQWSEQKDKDRNKAERDKMRKQESEQQKSEEQGGVGQQGGWDHDQDKRGNGPQAAGRTRSRL